MTPPIGYDPIMRTQPTPSNMTSRPVTELDFRMPEFRDAKPEDYEFRGDGKIVRKDRFERGIYKIASLLSLNGRAGFEIEDVIRTVENLAEESTNWQAELTDEDWAYGKPPKIDVKLDCGSILRNVTRNTDGTFDWEGRAVPGLIMAIRVRYPA